MKELAALLFWVLILQTDKVILALLYGVGFGVCLFLLGAIGVLIGLEEPG